MAHDESVEDTSLRLLKSAPLFSHCCESDLQDIASFSGILELEDGETVFLPGDPADRLYIVGSGEIVIRRDDGEGRSVDIARFLEGDCFGELDMFVGADRNAAAAATGPVSLLAFPAGPGGYEELTRRSPGTSARLLHSFLVQVSARIRDVNVLVKENSPIVQELKRQVYVDKLTGLNNRTYFDEVLETSVAKNDRVGLLLYKPDNFKQINDSQGHDAGDRVLRYIADRLREFVDDEDMLFRYMGNENAIIFPGISRDGLAEQAEKAGRFLENLDLSPALDGADIKLSVSVGLALYPDHASTARDLAEAAHPLTLEGRRRGGGLRLFPEDSIEP